MEAKHKILPLSIIVLVHLALFTEETAMVIDAAR
jgi:hypothetical protein|tara:strand:- start:839 stop:940 length:102 start_codon:yes stop_codon:yes gene_type:complete